MPCPACGSTAPAPGGRCPDCGAPVAEPGASPAGGSSPGGPGVSTSDPAETQLTPPPSPSPDTPRASSANTGPLAPGEPFGTRYRILKVLGAGGMGVVYQAWDAELGVVVALKVVRPEVMNDPHAAQEIERRFKRELLLARQVTHKNVVRIHDLGEVGGVKYITMPFVEGEDLSHLLKREGPLDVDPTFLPRGNRRATPGFENFLPKFGDRTTRYPSASSVPSGLMRRQVT